MQDTTERVRDRLRRYPPASIVFTKKDKTLLMRRIGATEEAVREELTHPDALVHAAEQRREHKDAQETRHLGYFVYSRSRGRCYVLVLNKALKVITVWPMGRTTLRRYLSRIRHTKDRNNHGTNHTT